MVYERIHDLRKDMGWSQEQVAEMLYINRRTYSSYENGIRGIPTETLIRLAKIFHTSVDFLLGLTDEQKPYGRSEAHRE